MAADVREILSGTRLFADLSGAELESLASHARRRRYQKGEIVFLRGDPGSSLYVVESGRIKIQVASPDGKEALLNILGPGDFFGEMALLDGEPRSADAVAMEASELLLLQRDDFLRFLRQHPDAGATLIAVLSRWLRRNAEIVQDTAFLDVPARLARAILHLAETQGQAGPEGVRIPTRLTQAELAGLVGATRESVNKWLGFYERQGLVHYDRGQITVLKPEALRKRIY